jgi:hypothetical protein
MNNKIKTTLSNAINNTKMVFSDMKYMYLFIVLVVVFLFLYSFAWGIIFLPDFYLRTDVITFENVSSLVIISLLAGLTITLTVFKLKMNMSAYSGIGFFSIIPAFFISACPGCVPLILSFVGTTFVVGLTLIQFGLAIKIFSILVLLTTSLHLSLSIRSCDKT